MAAYSGGSLAKTGGGAGLWLASPQNLQWVVAVIIALVLLGAVTYRLANRGKRYEG